MRNRARFYFSLRGEIWGMAPRVAHGNSVGIAPTIAREQTKTHEYTRVPGSAPGSDRAPRSPELRAPTVAAELRAPMTTDHDASRPREPPSCAAELTPRATSPAHPRRREQPFTLGARFAPLQILHASTIFLVDASRWHVTCSPCSPPTRLRRSPGPPVRRGADAAADRRTGGAAESGRR